MELINVVRACIRSHE